MEVGIEWLVEATGCAAAALRDPGVIRTTCQCILTELDLHVVGTGQVEQFPEPGGITALYLLTESHLACHTYPEHGVATFNLYCCRARPDWPWSARLGDLLGATAVHVRQVTRGLLEPGMGARQEILPEDWRGSLEADFLPPAEGIPSAAREAPPAVALSRSRV